MPAMHAGLAIQRASRFTTLSDPSIFRFVDGWMMVFVHFILRVHDADTTAAEFDSKEPRFF